MTSFVLDSNDLYVACLTKTKKEASFPRHLQVYKLKNSVKDYMVMDDDWDTTCYTIDPRNTSGYNSLVINGSTVDINMLTEDLFRSRLRANRLGYCFYEIPQTGPLGARTATTSSTDTAENFRYYRMNDLWNWSAYGAKADLNEEQGCMMRWDRLDILRGTPIIFKHQEMAQELAKMKNDLKLAKHLMSSLEEDKRDLKNGIEKLKELERMLQGGGIITASTSSAMYNPMWSSVSNLTTCPVPPKAFNIHYSPFDASSHDVLYLRDYRCAVRSVTPMYLPVTQVNNDVFTIFVNGREANFDTNNWYRITTMELGDTELLVYLGSRYYMKIDSINVAAPLDPNTPHFYSKNLDFDTGFRPFFELEPMMLHNLTIKFCISLNTSCNTLDKLGSVPEEGVGLGQVFRNLLKFSSPLIIVTLITIITLGRKVNGHHLCINR